MIGPENREKVKKQRDWQKYTLPLREVGSINFKNEPAPELGKIEQDIHIAQLNYGVLRHLIRCFQILELLNRTFFQTCVYFLLLHRWHAGRKLAGQLEPPRDNGIT